MNGKIDKVVVIDQDPIGRTPRSNPATYVKVFDEIRALFAQTREAKIRVMIRVGFLLISQGVGVRSVWGMGQ